MSGSTKISKETKAKARLVFRPFVISVGYNRHCNISPDSDMSAIGRKRLWRVAEEMLELKMDLNCKTYCFIDHDDPCGMENTEITAMIAWLGDDSCYRCAMIACSCHDTDVWYDSNGADDATAAWLLLNRLNGDGPGDDTTPELQEIAKKIVANSAIRNLTA